jgi:hypothetical protein
LDEQLQKSKEGRIRNHSGHLEQNKPPAAVNIDDMLDEDIGDISSSSEIEIDEPLGKFATLFPLIKGRDCFYHYCDGMSRYKATTFENSKRWLGKIHSKFCFYMMLKVSKSQKQFFLKLRCPKSNLNF